ncbi:MAG: ATP-binding cassette domain-containing protein [Candidatus Cloacimonas sp.]|nr:ATP-binding cassette domain-containing protein [Candidatus Cloacimonadota bacterium]
MKKPIIQVNNLTAKYGEKVVLSDISVDIYPEEITVILGPSGCGKSTFLKNILRLNQPAEGSVNVFGDNITIMEEDEYEKVLRKIGVLFQNGALLNSIDIFENLSIPLEQHTSLPSELMEKIIRIKLELVNLSHAINLKPSELSGGMRKRAALARAIVLDPEILFCDEPSAGLDPLTSAALDELILNLKNQLKMTVIIVTHELASIHRIADKIIFLDQGKMLFYGTVDEAKNSGIEEIVEFFRVGSF